MRLLQIGPLRALAIQGLLLQEWLHSGVVFNPTTRRFLRDPYPAYRRLQTNDPVHWSNLARAWVVTRFDDVMAVLRDPRFGADRTQATNYEVVRRGLGGPFSNWFEQSLLGLDPPDHTRLRGLINEAFTPRAIERMAPRIAEIVHELLDAVQDHGRMDLIADLAYPLPVIVIAEMLGIPAEDRDAFKRWSDDLGAGLDPFAGAETIARADRAVEGLSAYLQPLVEQRRRAPCEDLLSALVSAEQAGQRLNEAELYATVILLIGAGNETTTNLIGNGMLALLRHLDQFESLRADPALMGGAIEEMLRYEGPVQLTSRVAAEDVEVGGVPIRAGQTTIAVLGAANRDPKQFPNPDAFKIARPEARHLAFGHGIHFCLGSPMARLEASVALPILLERLPRLRLAEPQPPWRETMVLRGLQRLPVAF